MAFWVDNVGDYSEAGTIHLMDGDDEIVMWDSAEWMAEPALVHVIVNAIEIGWTFGASALRDQLENQRP